MPSKPPRKPPPCAAVRREPVTRRADRRRGSSARRGYDADWRRLRAWWLSTRPTCFNFERCGNAADAVDHIVPIAIAPGRRLDPTNLRSVCRACHDRITRNYQHHGRNEL